MCARVSYRVGGAATAITPGPTRDIWTWQRGSNFACWLSLSRHLWALSQEMGGSRNRDEATDIETHTTETHFLILRPAAKTLCRKATPPPLALFDTAYFKKMNILFE